MRSGVRWVLAILALILVGILAFYAGRYVRKPDKAAALDTPAKDEPPAWITYSEVPGLKVDLPPKWEVHADSSTGSIELLGDLDEQLVIWPLGIRGTLDSSSASAVLQAAAGILLPQVRWQAVETTPAPAVRLRGESPGTTSIAVVTWVVSPAGTAVFASTISAPKERFASAEAVVSRVLASARIGGASATSLAPPKFVRWQEPSQGAFGADVPRLWTVTGSIAAGGRGYPCPALDITSPNGAVHVKLGDAEMPGFIIPDPIFLSEGLLEGAWFTAHDGEKLKVRNYVPGAPFAEEFARSRLAAGYPQFELKESRSRPDLAREVERILKSRAGIVSTRVTAGEVAFTCESDCQQMAGSSFAVTVLSPSEAGGGVWHVPIVSGFLSSAGKTAMAASVLDRALLSFRYGDDWWSKRDGIVGTTPEILGRIHATIAQSITGGYWTAHVPTHAPPHRPSTFSTLGNVLDPANNRQVELTGGCGYYWLDANGRIAGTDVAAMVAVDFAALVHAP